MKYRLLVLICLGLFSFYSYAEPAYSGNGILNNYIQWPIPSEAIITIDNKQYNINPITRLHGVSGINSNKRQIAAGHSIRFASQQRSGQLPLITDIRVIYDY